MIRHHIIIMAAKRTDSWKGALLKFLLTIQPRIADQAKAPGNTTEGPSDLFYWDWDEEATSANSIGHFQKYHNKYSLFGLQNFAFKHCFQFLLGPTMVPGENINNTYAKFLRANKEYYGIFESGLFQFIWPCLFCQLLVEESWEATWNGGWRSRGDRTGWSRDPVMVYPGKDIFVTKGRGIQKWEP